MLKSYLFNHTFWGIKKTSGCTFNAEFNESKEMRYSREVMYKRVEHVIIKGKRYKGKKMPLL